MTLPFSRVGQGYNFLLSDGGFSNYGEIDIQAIINFTQGVPLFVTLPDIGASIKYYPTVLDMAYGTNEMTGTVEHYQAFNNFASVKVMEEAMPINLQMCKP